MQDNRLIHIERAYKRFARDARKNIVYGCRDIAAEFLGRLPAAPELRAGEFWALHDISLSVTRGQCLGVIGMNGAGKSTLLKVIGNIIKPDCGSARASGRVVSLIEVGAGFHPLLTGRENIYLNGTILGMTRDEISRKFNDIVEFSGIGEFIDAPVRSYSSGMHVRLGFAIAAHASPDVLLLDEVLAVGDLEFTARCLDFISHCRKHSAIVLVSHDFRMISRLCDSALYLERGDIAFHGEPHHAIAMLRAAHAGTGQLGERIERDVGIFAVSAVGGTVLTQHQPAKFVVEFNCDRQLEGFRLNIAVHREDGVHCFGAISPPMGARRRGRYTSEIVLPKLALMPGRYSLSVLAWDVGTTNLYAAWRNALYFSVRGNEMTEGVYSPEIEWQT